MEKLEFTVLCENTATRDDLAAEHGFSALLRRGELDLLFDCGDSGVFIDNADALNLDLRGVEAVVLSHNHYDHTRGFSRFVREYNHDYTLYLSRRFFKTGYWADEAEPGLLKPTSGPLSHNWLMRNNVDFRLVGKDVYALERFPGAYVLSNIPRTVDFEQPDALDVVETPSGELATDPYLDEQVLVAESASGLVVVSGCSHTGIVNILEHVKNTFANQPIAAFLSGTHLVAADGARIEKTMDYLKTANIEFIGVCHCTGEVGFEAAKSAGFGRLGGGFQMAF